jgi:hypothetical protein
VRRDVSRSELAHSYWPRPPPPKVSGGSGGGTTASSAGPHVEVPPFEGQHLALRPPAEGVGDGDDHWRSSGKGRRTASTCLGSKNPDRGAASLSRWITGTRVRLPFL